MTGLPLFFLMHLETIGKLKFPPDGGAIWKVVTIHTVENITD